MSKREVRNLPRKLMRLVSRAGQDVISVCQYQGILIISPELPWWLSGEEFASWVRKIPLEKATATHSSILARRIPWTEEPGGLQSMMPQESRHNLVTEPPPRWVS